MTLAGMRVIDFGHDIAAPLAAVMLADDRLVAEGALGFSLTPLARL